MIKIECEQGSEEWKRARIAVITASRFRDATDKLKNGNPSAKATLYAAQIAVERISGEPCDEVFVNAAMRRGTELEPKARLSYEVASGNSVNETGIVLTDDRLFGYSTDGEVGDDGLIEIKCLSSAEKLIAMWRDRDISEFQHQIQGGLWITGRKWCDFIMYAPQLAPVGKQLFYMRVHRDESFIEQLEIDLMQFAAMVADNERVLRQQAA